MCGGDRRDPSRYLQARLRGGWAAPRKEEGAKEALREPGANRIHYGASSGAAVTDMQCQPVLSQLFLGISCTDTLRIPWRVGAGSRPSHCSVTLHRCVEKMSWGRLGL